ncbi:MAG: hypothetical protein RI955_1656 [Bacteroidota bacterium]|jgi:O-antigen/teichoic acid export membrane protein
MSSGSLKKLSANSFLYSISSILQRASSIFLFPIFSSYLTKTDYGILSYTSSLSALIMIMAMFELPRAMSRMIYSKGEKTGHVYHVVGSVFVATLFSSSIICIGLLLTAKWLLIPYLGNISFYPFIFVTIINMPFQAIYNVYISYIKSAQKGKQAFMLDNAYFILNVGFNLLFVVGFKMNVIGMIYSTICSNLIMGTYATIVFYRRAIYFFNKAVLKSCIKYGASVFPFIFLGNISEYSDNFFLNKYIGADSLGIFYIATTFAGIFSIIKESVISAFQPYYFNLDKHGKIDIKIHGLINDLLFAVGIGAMLIAYYNYEVIYVFSRNKDLLNACKFVPMLVGGYYLVFVGQMLNIPIFLNRQNMKYMIFITIICFIINVGGNMYLIPKLGILGLCFVKIASYGSQVFSSSILNHRNEIKYHYPYTKMYLITASVAAIIGLYYIPFPMYIYTLLFKSIVAIIIIFAFYIYTNKKYKLNNLITQQLQKFNIIK